MAGIEIEYRGYPIRFDENRDQWHNYDLGVEDVSLANVKKKIDAIHLKLRKDSAIDVLLINSHGREMTEGRAMDARSVGWRTSNQPEGWAHEIAVMAKRRGGERASKQWTKPDKIALPIPKVFEAIDHATHLTGLAKEADKKARAAWNAIPTISHDDVAGLIRAAEAKIEEGE